MVSTLNKDVIIIIIISNSSSGGGGGGGGGGVYIVGYGIFPSRIFSLPLFLA